MSRLTRAETGAARNIRLYPWFRFLHGLLFWQAIWFLYFQEVLSASEAVLIYVIFDLSTTALEVPMGILSDRVGRRITLVLASVAGGAAALIMALSTEFLWVAFANVLLGAWAALSSGTDSALLYESLRREGRAAQIEAEEVRAWQFNFAALALSAAIGGAAATSWIVLPYFLTAAALFGAVWIALQFDDGPSQKATTAPGLGEIRMALAKIRNVPVLRYLFVLSVMMYGLSHVSFVFGQPYILEALRGIGLGAEAPLVSGAVTALMMGVSVLVSFGSGWLRRALGLARLLMLALFVQVALIMALALSTAALAIALLVLRMVPNPLSTPFMTARIQPELPDSQRATYLSLQSFCGRLFFAASLFAASKMVSDTGQMAPGELGRVLALYAGLGALTLIGMALWARRVPLEPPKTG